MSDNLEDVTSDFDIGSIASSIGSSLGTTLDSVNSSLLTTTDESQEETKQETEQESKQETEQETDTPQSLLGVDLSPISTSINSIIESIPSGEGDILTDVDNNDDETSSLGDNDEIVYDETKDNHYFTFKPNTNGIIHLNHIDDEEVLNNYYSKLKEYFYYKNKYTENVRKLKSKILEDNKLNKKEKKNQIASLKPKCFKCKKEVGMVFSEYDDFYYGRCGEPSNCKFHIKLNKPKYIRTKQEEEAIEYNLNFYYTRIIELKLKLLFELIDESTMITEFEKIKQEIEKYSNYKSSIYNFKNLLLDTEYRNEKIDILKKKIEDHTFIIQDLRKQYDNTNDKQIIKEIISEYVNGLKKSYDKLRHYKYDNRLLNQENNVDHDYKYDFYLEQPSVETFNV